MELQVIGSGSSGNAYILSYQEKQLLLDVGLPIAQIKKAFQYDFSNLQGALITHEHSDHIKGLKDLLDLGIDCYGLVETFQAVNVEDSFFINEITVGDIITIPPFIIQVLPAKHDCPIVSYVITMGSHRLLFLTDSYEIPYTIQDIDTFLIEANYDINILNQNTYANPDLKYLNDRITKSHLSIDNLLKFLETNDNRSKQIILIHLSDNNANRDDFVRRVEHLTGKPTYVAYSGFTLTDDNI